MLRRGRVSSYYWSRYRLPTQMPKLDGPPPLAAPQNMNDTDSVEHIDPIEDSFPVSIRGNMMRPDVPEDQYVDAWYMCTSQKTTAELKPWSASAPGGAFRFRPFNEFDAKGRAYVEKFRQFQKDMRGQVNPHLFPFRESYLTRMNPDNAVTPPASLHTIMNRAVTQEFQYRPHAGPLEIQRDVGRTEPPLPCASKIAPDRGAFPFSWRTEDWYEFEVSRARLKRFKYENAPGNSVFAAEVTYKILLEGFWDHHVARLADDVTMFLKDVGRQLVEEKLIAVRSMLRGLDRGSVDPQMLEAFNAARAGPFGGKNHAYDASEVAQFLKRELEELEEQCVSIINRCNVPIPGGMNIYDQNVSWPYVERLEPWVRMTESWTSASDLTFTENESSSVHYEFRKFFRTVIVKLPFQSHEFEKRMYDIRHWLHRQCSAEFHTVYTRNVIHDSAIFPTEHDPVSRANHEHHRMFSFALDWQSMPIQMKMHHVVRTADETWGSIAQHVGCTESELRLCNPEVAQVTVGTRLVIPRSATKRQTALSPQRQLISLTDESGGHVFKTWQEVADACGCSVEELHAVNGEVALASSTDIPSSVTSLVLPPSISSGHVIQFASTEPVLAQDTWESIADRIGSTVSDLQAANSNASLDTYAEVTCPPSSKRLRRLIDPQLRPEAAGEELLPRTSGEAAKYNLASGIPALPKDASKFPYEFTSTTSRFPSTPSAVPEAQDNWLSYTAKYLDRDLSIKDEAMPTFNVNKLWPMIQVPGKVDQTPFEEDQTWLMHHIPVHQMQLHHPEGDLQDLPLVNHEQFPRSIEWTAP